MTFLFPIPHTEDMPKRERTIDISQADLETVEEILGSAMESLMQNTHDAHSRIERVFLASVERTKQSFANVKPYNEIEI